MVGTPLLSSLHSRHQIHLIWEGTADAKMTSEVARKLLHTAASLRAGSYDPLRFHIIQAVGAVCVRGVFQDL